MSDIEISYPHSLGSDEMKSRVQKLEAKMTEKFGVKLNWEGNAAAFKGMGVDGKINVSEDAIKVNIKLGLMMRPMASKIRETMDHQIQKMLS